MPRTLEDARRALASGHAALAREICDELHLTVGESADSLSVMGAAAAFAGEFEAAATHLRRAIVHAPDRPLLHGNLGRMQTALGRLDAAGRSFVTALGLVPTDPQLTLHHAAILANTGHPADAARLIRSVVAAKPDWEPVVTDLAHAEQATGSRSLILKAANAARAAGDTRIETVGVHGEAAARLESWAVAFDCFRTCATAEPDNADYQAGLAVAARHLGQPDLAAEASHRALTLRPYSMRGSPRPRRRALVIEPFTGQLMALPGRWLGYSALNFPSILHAPDWRLIHAPLGPGMSGPLLRVAREADVLINNWASAELLEKHPVRKDIEDLALQGGLPMINAPADVLQTGRGLTAERFRGVRGFVFPETIRTRVGPSTVPADLTGLTEPPFILRTATGHRGANAALIERESDLAPALRRIPEGEAYLIRYHECRDERGIARRYRLGVVDGQPIPLNMHAARDWNVHHVDRAKMGWVEAGLDEAERLFLRQPEALLGGPAAEVFAPIVSRTPLDVYGIDFGLDLDGRIVVFEVNAAMAFSTSKLAEWPVVMEQRAALIDAIFALMERRIEASRPAA